MTSTVSWGNPTAQWGTLTGGVWTTLAFADGVFGAVDPTAGTVLGVLFTWSGLEYSGTRVVDNPVVSGITLRVPVRGVVANAPRTVRVSCDLDFDSADYSTASAPLTRGETVVGTFTVPASGAFDLVTPVTESLVLSTAMVTQIRMLVTGRALWEGRIAFVLEDVTAPPDGTAGFLVANGPSYPLLAQMEQDLFFSGLTGGPSGKVRAVRDARFAMPAFSPELVQDGDQPGLWVRSFDQDPEDPENQYRPRPGEGSVEDEIPDL